MGKISEALKKVEKTEIPKNVSKNTFFKERLLPSKSTDSSINSRVIVYHNPSSPISEQYKILRTNIKSCLTKLHLEKSNPYRAFSSKIFTITSSLHNEGKTLTCANLAVALALDRENRILLIDCDLRRGTLHQLFGIDSRPGLSDLLTTDFDEDISLHRTPVKNLFIIPRGEKFTNPSDLFTSKKMKQIIEKLRTKGFSYIILDTPPLILFTDANVLGTLTEGIILVVQAGRTPLQVVQKAEEFIHQSSNKLLGFIFTQVDYYTSDYYYSYYYYTQKP